MRIGIFGGTFNPIHFGHLVLAEQAFEKLNLGKVIFIPSFQPPHKNNPGVVSAVHRYKLVSLAIKGNPRFEISDIEIKRKGFSYLVDTLKGFKRIYPKSELFFISGSDVSGQIGKWRAINEILGLCKFVLAKRPGYRLKKYNKDISVISITELDISSSMIRRKIKQGQSVRYLMPMRVYKYIKNKGLYQ
ncbi:MAG: nicotinate-nucleotide adenylyltransferase [Candidatus Omnitrophica bacterium]|nr:nicotinate-nucleotide adenylyltransferase [Candidatus Omnitrophota bacterium]MDD5352724.1 nicotinate-nucleotide adenylyltransferase [Candidatus Omnitrophota bacterium]MDD5550323.1 nicotinate-nucleotide adenylyltransferase [Candidatus Omnitrophota bacterium]